ncbi:hypothetical protein GGX14DRAFT_451009 [Mycena pura]|uniref:Uncharacterized protein n=1 Tax=Mycena pura TaxID=153505 RepID=A0AAD6YFI0_9AGAR|nr:hypothetical protein GGX14DRAFT_451009 [Mycena pura]
MEMPVARAEPAEVIEIDSDSDDEEANKTQKRKGDHPSANLLLAKPPAGEATDADSEERAVLEKMKEEIVGILDDGLRFEGAIACFERYSPKDAPNPFLRIDGLGAIGIPLSSRDAAAILSFGFSETDIDLELSKKRWEQTSTQVHFDNPEWDAWIREKAGPKAYKDLGGSVSAPATFEFRKLILQEPGSQQTKSQGQIGTLVVILPCTFSGARLQVRHDNETVSVDLEHQSGLLTSVVAAFSAVTSGLAPILSGYRLSLAYDILQGNSHPSSKCLRLPDMHNATQRLRRILESWMNDAACSKSLRLHFLLREQYQRGAEFGRDALIGSDAHLITHLIPLVEELGLHLHFAHISVEVTASASVEEYDYDGYGPDPYDDIGEADFCFDIDAEVEDTCDELPVTVVQVVDLEGMPLKALGVNFSLDDLIDGSSLTAHDPAEGDSHFERDEDAFVSYRRTVLLISKSVKGFSPNIGEIYDYAVSVLRDSESPTPIARELTLVDGLLQLAETDQYNTEQVRAVAPLLAKCADRWKNLPTLLRTLKACRVDRRMDLLGVENLITIYQVFGWDALKDFFGEALQNDETNTTRQAFLTALSGIANKEGSTVVIQWCAVEQDVLLRRLRAVDVDQIGWLVELATARGGEFLRDVIFPQLKAQTLDKTFWITLTNQLQNIAAWPSELVAELVSFCISRAVDALPVFPTAPSSQPYSRRPEADIDSIMEVIRICVETKNNQYCARISERMRQTASATPDITPHLSAWMFYLRLVPVLDTYLGSQETPSEFKPFFADAVEFMLRAGKNTDSKCSMSPANLIVINMAIRRAGGMSFLNERLTAEWWTARTSADLQELVRSIRKIFLPPSGESTTDPQGLDIISALVDITIRAFDVSALIPRAPTLSYTVVINDILNLINFCFEFNTPNKCQGFLLTLLEPPAGLTLPQHVDKVLVPLLQNPALKTLFAVQHLDYGTDPFKFFSVATVKTYANTMMVLKPHELVAAAELEGVGCRGVCAECASLKAFFRGDSPLIDFSRAQKTRYHLESHLHSTSPWGVTWETLKLGSPHTLRIKKPAWMSADTLARSTQRGMALLAEFGDAEAQRRFLGADFDWILAKISPPKKARLRQPV